MKENPKAFSVLAMNTLAFTVCFAVWMMNGVLVTFLVENRVFDFDKVQIGWLMGIPVLTGSVVRLPVGMATDRWGGKVVFPIVMLVAAVATYLLSFANTFGEFALGSLGFGLAGTGFAVGIAYTSVWFRKEHQGTALGVFGVGNAGSAVTSMLGPTILKSLTAGGTSLDGWRTFPKIYALALVVMAVVFVVFTKNKRPAHGGQKTVSEQLAPLKIVRVWRFGLYYFLVFGGFVALAQWLIPYYVGVYGVTLATAGLLATIFNLPSGLIRALGGWMSDKLGARTTMYWVLGSCAVCCAALIVPRMDITSPGESVLAVVGGTVTGVTATEVIVGDIRYPYTARGPTAINDAEALVWPSSEYWQEPVVRVGDRVKKRQLLARGTTHIYFQANLWIFTALVFIVGIMMGIGKAAVYKHIPEYFPEDVGVVGGLVGVIGGLGGFVCPIIFGYLLRATGLWTTCWMFFTVLSVISLIWMHMVIRRMMKEKAPSLVEKIDDALDPGPHRAGEGAHAPAATKLASEGAR